MMALTVDLLSTSAFRYRGSPRRRLRKWMAAMKDVLLAALSFSLETHSSTTNLSSHHFELVCSVQHDITVGTSFATPVVSAVAALMLQANPELGWRDVQAILAITSQKQDFSDESWTTNSAGISHSYKYGFGVSLSSSAVIQLCGVEISSHSPIFRSLAMPLTTTPS